MIKQVQKGFTLIELMIVVAIIGILAAIAIPAYTDYTVRARMSEAVVAMSAGKASVSEFFISQGEMPADVDAAGFSNVVDTPVVSALTYAVQAADDTAQIIVTIKDSGGETADGQQFGLTAQGNDNDVQWACYTIDVATKYLPANCRQDLATAQASIPPPAAP